MKPIFVTCFCHNRCCQSYIRSLASSYGIRFYSDINILQCSAPLIRSRHMPLCTANTFCFISVLEFSEIFSATFNDHFIANLLQRTQNQSVVDEIIKSLN